MEPYVQRPDPEDHEDSLQYERDILNKWTGLKLGESVHVVDVPIDYHGKNNYIHTIRCGDQNKVDMVMIHGYGGSAITFYRMFKTLAENYRVFAYDMLGMGLSSRPTFDLTDSQKCIDFFVESMELWRQKMGLTHFHLVGHSMGGYIAGHYAAKYPQYVFKLSLLSPAGINKNCEEMDMDKWIEGLDFWKKMYMEYMWNYWKKRKTPQTVFKELGLFGRILFGKYLESRFNMLKKEEVNLFFDYLMSMVQEPESSEKALHCLYLPPRATAFIPLEDHLLKMKIPIDLYFGTRDWIDWNGPQRMAEKTDGRIKCIFVPFAGHQLIIENSLETAENIVLYSEKWINLDERYSVSTASASATLNDAKEVSSPQLSDSSFATTEKITNITEIETKYSQEQAQLA